MLSRAIRLYGLGYPGWRHAVMVGVDLLVVLIALRFTSWLVYALIAFLLEQLVVKGVGPTSIFVLAALVFVARDTWLSRQRNPA